MLKDIKIFSTGPELRKIDSFWHEEEIEARKNYVQ